MNMNKPPEPLPCPFCGSKPEVKHYEYIGQWRIVCNGCEMMPMTGQHYSRDEVVRVWNKRAPVEVNA